MPKYVRIPAPDPTLWSEQEHFIRLDTIHALRLSKKMGNAGSGSDNGIMVYTISDRGSASTSFWVRCPSFESARELYESIVTAIEEQ